MRKKRYVASVWVPGQQHPAASLSAGEVMPSVFERIVDGNQAAPFYESSNYAAIILNLETGECRTYANMPYRLIVKDVTPITQEEFKNGDRFKLENDKDKRAYYFEIVDDKPELITAARSRFDKVVHRRINDIVYMDYIELADEDKTRIYFHEMLKYD